MNEESRGWSNSSGGPAGIQAGGDVHDSNVYIGGVEDPPERRYALGVRHLEDGIPSRARELIADAMAHDFDGSEVRFHWVLALLSKRGYRDLSPDEREQLARTEESLDSLSNDGWTRALDIIYELLGCLRDRARNPGPVVTKLRSLDANPRDKIIHHLEHVLIGSIKDSFWVETRNAAAEGRRTRDRQGRVWAYFEPDPIPPRARKPVPDETTLRDRLLAITWSTLLTVSAGYLGWLVLSHPSPLAVVAYVSALAAGYVATRTGSAWYYCRRRLRVKDREYFGPAGVNRTASESGFASSVGHRFDHYFATYVPKGASRDAWLAEIAGVKRRLRDEIADRYREARIGVGRVNWLIRHLVSGVSRRWEDGTLWMYREQYRVAPGTKVWCTALSSVLCAAVVVVVVTAVGTAVLPVAAATLVLLWSAFKASRRWLEIIYERRRLLEDHEEYDQAMRERTTAYERWKEKLRSTRPSENEMESWLTCDRTALLDEALEHYRLAWRDVLAYAFLQTPSKGCQKARAKRGPWRYSKYDVRLFLITHDGVRELSTQLNFREISFQGQERNNYRFDAVSSVFVVKRSEYSHELKLTLTNGPSHEIHVDLEVPLAEPDEDASAFARMNLDTAGFTHTLRILEGIAAEGKGWINRDSHANGKPPDPFAEAG